MLGSIRRSGDLEHQVKSGIKWKDGFQGAKNEAIALSKAIERLAEGDLDVCMEILCTRLMLLSNANKLESWDVADYFGTGDGVLAMPSDRERQMLSQIAVQSRLRKQLKPKGKGKGAKGASDEDGDSLLDAALLGTVPSADDPAASSSSSASGSSRPSGSNRGGRGAGR